MKIFPAHIGIISFASQQVSSVPYSHFEMSRCIVRVSAKADPHQATCSAQLRAMKSCHDLNMLHLSLSFVKYGVHDLQGCHCTVHFGSQSMINLMGHICTSYVCSSAVHSSVAAHRRGGRLRTTKHQELHSQHASAEYTTSCCTSATRARLWPVLSW